LCGEDQQPSPHNLSISVSVQPSAPVLSLDELQRSRDMGVDDGYIRDMAAAG